MLYFLWYYCSDSAIRSCHWNHLSFLSSFGLAPLDSHKLSSSKVEAVVSLLVDPACRNCPSLGSVGELVACCHQKRNLSFGTVSLQTEPRLPSHCKCYRLPGYWRRRSSYLERCPLPRRCQVSLFRNFVAFCSAQGSCWQPNQFLDSNLEHFVDSASAFADPEPKTAVSCEFVPPYSDVDWSAVARGTVTD